MDGTLGSRTALLLGGGGMRLMGPDGLAAVVREAAAAGMPVAVHAIGDLANREALDGFEATEDVWRPLGLRHRVEHAQCIHADDIARYARLGITASVQYSHATSDRELAARLWADRLDRAYPYRQLLDAGVRVAGGSDAPVEDARPAGRPALRRRMRREPRRGDRELHRRARVARGRRGPPRPLSTRLRRRPRRARRRPRARDDGRRALGPGSAARVARSVRGPREAARSQPSSSASTSSTASSPTRCVMFPEPNEPASAKRSENGTPGQPQPDVDPRLGARLDERELLRPPERHVGPARADLDVHEVGDDLGDALVDRPQRGLRARVLAIDQLPAAGQDRGAVLLPPQHGARRGWRRAPAPAARPCARRASRPGAERSTPRRRARSHARAPGSSPRAS